MKLIIAAEIFPPDIGGPATYSKKFAKELIHLGWEVELICYSQNKQKNDFSFKVFRIIKSRIKGWHYFKYFFKLLRLAFKCDVIYAQGPISSGLPAVVVAFLLRKKVVVKVVGDYAWEQYMNKQVKLSISKTISIDEFQKRQEKKFDKKIELLKWIEKKVCNKADKVIVPSRYLKNIVQGWGVKEHKVNVIYNSINLMDKFGAIDKVNARKKLGFNSNDFIVISVGRPVSWKGFGMLAIVSSELIEEENIPLKLRLLGVDNVSQLNRLIKLYEDQVVYENQPLSNSDKVVRVLKVEDIKDFPAGIQPKLKVYEYLLAADLFVLNTAYEGLPHTILEAMDAGVPVVTTNMCGNPEVVTDGYNGLLIEYNNKEQLKEVILKLYNNRELCHKLVANSKKVLEKFTFNKMISDTIKTLKSI